MKSIDNLLEEIIKNEGGFINHPQDRGGPTKYGITERTLANHLGHEVSIFDVQHLSLELAKDIYESEYYYAPKINKLPEELQLQVFDMAVNHGPRRAIKLLQKTLNRCGVEAISIDGFIGNQTLSAIKKILSTGRHSLKFLNNALVDNRCLYYEAIVSNNPSQNVFLKGWIRRADSFWVDVPGDERPLERIEYERFV